MQEALFLSLQSYENEQKDRKPKYEFKPIYLLNHCSHKIFSFKVIEECRFCKLPVLSSNNMFLIKYEDELTNSTQSPFHILIKTTLGSFQNYSKVSQKI